MLPLSTQQIVAVWERGQAASNPDLGLLLLSAAFPRIPVKDLLSLTLGQRDACLLRLRELTIGPELNCLTECPGCRAHVEVEARCSDITFSDLKTPVVMSHQLNQDGFHLEFRPVIMRDLLAIRGFPEVGGARETLLRRTITTASHDGQPVDISEIPPALIGKLGDILGEQDLQSEVRFRLTCPECGHSWASLFDVVSFFWKEITVRAQRFLSEVQQLARAYTWSESEILAMSTARRRFYLDAIS